MSAHPILDAIIGETLTLKPRASSASGFALEPVQQPIQGYQQSRWSISVTKHHGSGGFLAKGFLNDITQELYLASSASQSEAIGKLVEAISTEEKDSPFTIHLRP